MSILLIIGIIILVLVIFIVTSYNSLIKLRNNTQEAFSTMDVYLKKRYDLIPNIVETIKGYVKHEASTLEKVIQARNMASNATSINDSIDANNVLTNSLKSLFALSEAYPDLKANQNFIDLQNKLDSIENDIAHARKYYNATILNYNNKIEVVPTNIIANIFKFNRLKMYEVNSEEERENIKVSFE